MYFVFKIKYIVLARSKKTCPMFTLSLNIDRVGFSLVQLSSLYLCKYSNRRGLSWPWPHGCLI